MISLIKIEFYKILPNRTFWIFVILYITSSYLFFYGGSNIEIEALNFINFKQYYYFPRVWNSITYIAHFFTLLLGIIVISLVTAEFSYKTFRYQITCGLSKLDFVLAKILLILIFCIISTLFLAIVSLIFGFTHTHKACFTCLDWFSKSTYVLISNQMHFLITYFIQTFSYLSFAFLVGVIIKKTGLGIVLYVTYILFIEAIVRLFVPDQIDLYFPMNIISTLTPFPGKSLWQLASGVEMYPIPLITASLITMGYSLLFCLISYFLIKVRDV